MPLVDLRLDELVLQVPGLTRDQGSRLGRLVLERLATKAATGSVPSLTGGLRLELDASLPQALSLDELAERIVVGLSARLGLEG